ncbi:uncharacterized protein LOC131591015 isoform X2 [Poecile atricapillus]|uniref:uncharacterized protein LOC131591015 isoform X2 n=1 Tax=Poecile atricapillus TaxID=48891 RepID=UPI002738D156|nr:uncharacterized protein LOC131591015 isoform X2 [Poecile atricapillus]
MRELEAGVGRCRRQLLPARAAGCPLERERRAERARGAGRARDRLLRLSPGPCGQPRVVMEHFGASPGLQVGTWDVTGWDISASPWEIGSSTSSNTGTRTTRTIWSCHAPSHPGDDHDLILILCSLPSQFPVHHRTGESPSAFSTPQ